MGSSRAPVAQANARKQRGRTVILAPDHASPRSKLEHGQSVTTPSLPNGAASPIPQVACQPGAHLFSPRFMGQSCHVPPREVSSPLLSTRSHLEQRTHIDAPFIATVHSPRLAEAKAEAPLGSLLPAGTLFSAMTPAPVIFDMFSEGRGSLRAPAGGSVAVPMANIPETKVTSIAARPFMFQHKRTGDELASSQIDSFVSYVTMSPKTQCPSHVSNVSGTGEEFNASRNQTLDVTTRLERIAGLLDVTIRQDPVLSNGSIEGSGSSAAPAKAIAAAMDAALETSGHQRAAYKQGRSVALMPWEEACDSNDTSSNTLKSEETCPPLERVQAEFSFLPPCSTEKSFSQVGQANTSPRKSAGNRKGSLHVPVKSEASQAHVSQGSAATVAPNSVPCQSGKDEAALDNDACQHNRFASSPRQTVRMVCETPKSVNEAPKSLREALTCTQRSSPRNFIPRMANGSINGFGSLQAPHTDLLQRPAADSTAQPAVFRRASDGAVPCQASPQQQVRLATLRSPSPMAFYERPCKGGDGVKRALKLAVFDFDNTLTVFNVFASIAGSCTTTAMHVPPPHARTELGQLLRIVELDENPNWGSGAFAKAAFGSVERLAQLHALLKSLRDADVECIVCSRGMRAVVRRCLKQVGLLDSFTQVFGTRGSLQGLGPLESLGTFDRSLPAIPADMAEENHLHDHSYESVGKAKREVIQHSLERRGLKFDEAIFIDDNMNELMSVRHICLTMNVAQGGLGQREIGMLQTMMDARGCPVKRFATCPVPKDLAHTF